METKEALRVRLNQTVAELIAVCRQPSDPEAAVDEGWSVKDILGHLTFWHESFARNVNDLAHDRLPTPLKGTLSDLNQQGVDELRPCSLEEVIRRLQAAQRLVHRHILSPRITLIHYRKASRAYTPEEHLSLVIGHINAHLKAIRRASTNE
jgi:uncharacterized damage-inducible protein DinB